MMTIKDLKQGDYFTLNPIEYPNENQVYVRGEYVREVKAYICYKFSDINAERLIKGSKEIFTEFVF